jgi:hypothetical protein
MNQAAKVVNLLLEADSENVKGFLRRAGVTATGNYTLEPPGTHDRINGRPIKQHVVRDAKSGRWLGVITGDQFTFDFKPGRWVITQSLSRIYVHYGAFFKTREGAAAHLWHRWRNSDMYK